MKNTCLFGGTLVAAGLSAAASAQNVVIPASQRSVTASSVICEQWDLGALPDMGIVGFSDPVGNGGGGPIPPGFFTYATIGASYYGPGGPKGQRFYGLVGVGPSAGFGNPANFVGANYFVDAFCIDFGAVKCGFEWQGSSLLGGPGYDLYVDGVYLASLQNDVRYLLTGSFSKVEFYDPSGGAEGMWGDAIVYKVPTPGALALLGVGGLAAARRRRA